MTKQLAVPITKNGCGTKTGIGSLVPELWFHACCDKHDECYGTCSESYKGCNTAFLNCNLQTCGTLYPGSTVKRKLQRQGCEFFARLYGAAVKTSIGRNPYNGATPKYCNCVCTSPSFADCGDDACVDYRTDPRHCGGCNSNVSDSLPMFGAPPMVVTSPQYGADICLNGECYSDPCPGSFCENNTSSFFSTPLPTISRLAT